MSFNPVTFERVMSMWIRRIPLGLDFRLDRGSAMIAATNTLYFYSNQFYCTDWSAFAALFVLTTNVVASGKGVTRRRVKRHPRSTKPLSTVAILTISTLLLNQAAYD